MTAPNGDNAGARRSAVDRAFRVLAVAALGAMLYALNRSGALEAALAGIESLGPWAAPVFVALHAVSVVVLVPSIVPNFAAGALFGFLLGLPLTLLGAGLGAVAAFGLGRTVAHGWVERRFGSDSRFRALSKLARERGWKIVALARLTPIFPFSIGNYAFGVTAIRARDYFFASVLGTIPSNAVYVYLGALAGEVAAGSAAGRERTPAEWALLVAGLVATGVLVVFLRRLATDALGEGAGPGAH
jgi:uncharacterized membrane protein YdjX (TVP38/TMEM64 family)